MISKNDIIADSLLKYFNETDFSYRHTKIDKALYSAVVSLLATFIGFALWQQ